jgi:hypothetical protein
VRIGGSPNDQVMAAGLKKPILTPSSSVLVGSHGLSIAARELVLGMRLGQAAGECHDVAGASFA